MDKKISREGTFTYSMLSWIGAESDSINIEKGVRTVGSPYLPRRIQVSCLQTMEHKSLKFGAIEIFELLLKNSVNKKYEDANT